MDGYHLILGILRGLAWLGENFPDNPRLGRGLLFGGGLLLCAVVLSTDDPDSVDLILGIKYLCVIAGGVLLVLGSFVFFRRWVWRRQENRPPIITTLQWK